MDNFDLFCQTYKKKLEEAVIKWPQDYPWYPNLSIETVYGRMVTAFKNKSYNKDGHAIKNTCKELNIKHTYKAIQEYLGN